MLGIAGYAHGYDVADVEIAFDGDGPEAVGAAVHDAASPRVGGVNEDGLFGTDEAGHTFIGNLGLQCDGAGQAVFFFFTGDIVVHVRRFGAGARRIFEWENLGELRGFEHAERFLEFLFGFGGESNDEVGAELKAGIDSAHVFDFTEVLFDGVLSIHDLQEAIGPGLERDVQLIADCVAFGHEVGKSIVPIVGVWRGKAYAGKSVELRHGVQ